MTLLILCYMYGVNYPNMRQKYLSGTPVDLCGRKGTTFFGYMQDFVHSGTKKAHRNALF